MVDVLFRNKKWLQQKYWDDGLSTAAMARLAGCAHTTIQDWMHKYGIPARSKAEAITLARWTPDDSSTPLYRQREWLHRMYVVEGKSLAELSKLAGCTDKTISDWLRKYDLPVRTRSDAAANMWSHDDHRERAIVGMKAAAPKHREKDRARALRRWADPVYRESMSGANHWWWTGGKERHKHGYSDNYTASFREHIHDMDGNHCFLCDDPETLVVHHIDGDKMNTCEENCITLCNSCHSKYHKLKPMHQMQWRASFEEYVKE